MIKLSVIIPVYNTGKYLQKCLESIFSQSFQDFEVICVDDGSTDNSAEILNKFPKVTVFHTENCGSGVARNLALDSAKGEYVLFVDSDDWLVENAFEKLFSFPANFDVLIFGGLTFSKGRLRKGNYSINKIPKKYLNHPFNKNDFQKDIFKFPSTAWTKLYKRDFLVNNNIRFQKTRTGQDQVFFLKSVLEASSICVLGENLYCYRKRRPGSVTSIRKKTDFSPVEVFYEAEKIFGHGEYKDVILNKYFLKATFRLPKMQESLKSDYFERYLTILNHVKEVYPDFWWKYFNPNLHDSYIKLKIKHALCKLIYLGTKIISFRL